MPRSGWRLGIAIGLGAVATGSAVLYLLSRARRSEAKSRATRSVSADPPPAEAPGREAAVSTPASGHPAVPLDPPPSETAAGDVGVSPASAYPAVPVDQAPSEAPDAERVASAHPAVPAPKPISQIAVPKAFRKKLRNILRAYFNLDEDPGLNSPTSAIQNTALLWHVLLHDDCSRLLNRLHVTQVTRPIDASKLLTKKSLLCAMDALARSPKSIAIRLAILLYSVDGGLHYTLRSGKDFPLPVSNAIDELQVLRFPTCTVADVLDLLANRTRILRDILNATPGPDYAAILVQTLGARVPHHVAFAKALSGTVRTWQGMSRLENEVQRLQKRWQSSILTTLSDLFPQYITPLPATHQAKVVDHVAQKLRPEALFTLASKLPTDCASVTLAQVGEAFDAARREWPLLNRSLPLATSEDATIARVLPESLVVCFRRWPFDGGAERLCAGAEKLMSAIVETGFHPMSSGQFEALVLTALGIDGADSLALLAGALLDADGDPVTASSIPLPKGIGCVIMQEFGTPPSRRIRDAKRQLEKLIRRGDLLPGQDIEYYRTAMHQRAEFSLLFARPRS